MIDKQIKAFIERDIKAAFAGEISFPEAIKNLIDIDIERYYVDLIRLGKTSYAKDGTTYMLSLPLTNPSKIADKFSEGGVKEAIRAIQNGQIQYAEFLHSIMRAGVAAYMVFIDGKQVHYIGRRGEVHIEHFPQ